MLPAFVRIYGRDIVDTLHERIGEERLIAGNADDNPQQPMLWGRVIGAEGWNAGARGGIYQGDAKYNDNVLAYEGGFDVLRWIGQDGSRDHAGVYFVVGRISGNVTHFDGSAAGRDSVDSKTFGAYWTHFDVAGWYLDGLTEISWNTLKAEAVDVHRTLRTDGTDVTVSLEGGYPFDLGDGYRIEPQGQLVYQAISIEGASDPVARLGFTNDDSFVGRIGARFLRSWTLNDAETPQLLTTWLRPSLEYEFEGRPVTTFSSQIGPILFRADSGKSWVDLSAGADLQVTGTAALYASVGYQPPLTGHLEAVDAKIGARITW